MSDRNSVLLTSRIITIHLLNLNLDSFQLCCYRKRNDNRDYSDISVTSSLLKCECE